MKFKINEILPITTDVEENKINLNRIFVNVKALHEFIENNQLNINSKLNLNKFKDIQFYRQFFFLFYCVYNCLDYKFVYKVLGEDFSDGVILTDMPLISVDAKRDLIVIENSIYDLDLKDFLLFANSDFSVHLEHRNSEKDLNFNIFNRLYWIQHWCREIYLFFKENKDFDFSFGFNDWNRELEKELEYKLL